jgi:hypothetical protein
LVVKGLKKYLPGGIVFGPFSVKSCENEAVSFSMPVHPFSACNNSRTADFYEIVYWRMSQKFVNPFQIWLKSDSSNR